MEQMEQMEQEVLPGRDGGGATGDREGIEALEASGASDASGTSSASDASDTGNARDGLNARDVINAMDGLNVGKATDTPYEDLAAGIVLQAVNDYINAYSRMRNPRVSREKKREALLEKMELEAFFKSPWYDALCDIDPDTLIYQCRLRVDNRERRRERE